MGLYVVTGGKGFIGWHLVDSLVGAGHQVTVIDDESTGCRTIAKHQARWHKWDIADPVMLPMLVETFRRCDGVYHLAARPRVQLSIADPFGTGRVNMGGTHHVLEAARQAKVRRVVYTSSSSVYGEQDKLPLVETMVPNPLSPYAMHKRVGELMCQSYSDSFDLETVCLRPFNVYGPGFDPEGAYALVIGKFISLLTAPEGPALTITGTGEQKRDFTHVSDVVAAFVAAMESTNVGHGEIINIGAGNPVTVNYVAKILAGSDYPRTYLPARPGEPWATHADITKAKRVLGWEPKVKITMGLTDLAFAYGV